MSSFILARFVDKVSTAFDVLLVFIVFSAKRLDNALVLALSNSSVELNAACSSSA